MSKKLKGNKKTTAKLKRILTTEIIQLMPLKLFLVYVELKCIRISIPGRNEDTLFKIFILSKKGENWIS